MKTQISHKPSEEAGVHISSRLLKHAHEAVLFLISGGSALEVLKFIPTHALTSNITVVLTDERFTFEKDGSNFLAFSKTDFYTHMQKVGIQCLSSEPQEHERHEQFAKRISENIEQYFEKHPHGYTLGLFGIGEDGHTASIFPATEQDFQAAYTTDRAYVAITRPELQYAFRVSVTPSFIEEKIDEIVLYAVGSKKCDNILSYMHTKNFAVHEIPALIPARHQESVLFTDCMALL